MFEELKSEARRMLLEFLPMLTADENKDAIDDAVNNWLEVFASLHATALQGKTLTEKTSAFALFLRKLVPVVNVGMVKVSTKLARHYGAVTIEYGLEDYAPRTKAGVEAGYERVFRTVMTMHERYAAEHLPKVPGPANSNEPASNVEVMDCDRLSVKVEDGKVYIRAHGGRFSKFGVPVYDEVLKTIGLTKELPLEGVNMAGRLMHVQMNGGKPVRVKKFE